MRFGPEDHDIITLLIHLRDDNGEYPEHMLTAQRQRYLKRMAELGLGTGMGIGIEHAITSPGPPPPTPFASILLETILAVVIIAETGAVTYLYRDKLAEFFKTFTTESRVQDVPPPPVSTTSLDVQGVSPSPAVTATLPSVTISPIATEINVIATVTPIPGVAGEDNTNSAGVNSLNSTPVPLENSNGNNGNHYGQTPLPERTKENSGNGGGNDNGGGNNNETGNDTRDNGNNDRPPKDNNAP